MSREPLRQGQLLHWAGKHVPTRVRDRVWQLVVFRRPRPRWGNFRRTAPFSDNWGWDRGTPIDRVYIERFLREHAEDVRGDVLEIGGRYYTEMLGDRRVARSDVLDIDPDNTAATIVGDLASEETLPPDRFDCFILTQTVQLIGEIESAIANAYRALSAGGVLLLTVPTISRLGRSSPDYWRCTPAGLERIVERVVPADAEVAMVAPGNVLSATAFPMGIAAEELQAAELEVTDSRFPMLVCARLRKPV
jgi:hypothetical protein